ncbi:hypothetical protein B0T17DRAFT_535676 [Bombardia bombarda]|uniref:MARVEL domain-containing protein n=1 Tax=Bombardia bombarda TaxID=252184 RepID=A0AA39WUU1_9PEZI|nr:hypothetical protein B0T17DRAFT_535676 [Bombardia bombarda]
MTHEKHNHHHNDSSSPHRDKGGASRAASVFFRIGELLCGAVVLGLVGRLLYLVDVGGSDPNPRIVYTAVIAAVTIVLSLVFMPPLAYAFYAFPVDALLFVAWLVAFCLLETLTGMDYCNSDWYRSYWGYYWGRWYRVAPVGIDVNWTGCSAWRTVLAFTFMACVVHLLSAAVGIYWVARHGRTRERGWGLFHKTKGYTRGYMKGSSRRTSGTTATDGYRNGDTDRRMDGGGGHMNGDRHDMNGGGHMDGHDHMRGEDDGRRDMNGGGGPGVLEVGPGGTAAPGIHVPATTAAGDPRTSTTVTDASSTNV